MTAADTTSTLLREARAAVTLWQNGRMGKTEARNAVETLEHWLDEGPCESDAYAQEVTDELLDELAKD